MLFYFRIFIAKNARILHKEFQNILFHKNILQGIILIFPFEFVTYVRKIFWEILKRVISLYLH